MIRISTSSARIACAIALAVLGTACGDAPVRVGSGARSPRTPRTLFRGEIRLAPELASDGQGFVFTSARPAGSRMPVLSRRFTVSEFERQTTGGAVLRYQLTEADKMGGLEIPLPDRLELKFSYDPDGLVETFEGVESVIVPVVEGEDTYSVELTQGMAKPDEPPSAYEQQSPLPAGHPPLPAGHPPVDRR